MKKRAPVPELISPPAPGEDPFQGDRQFVTALWRGMEILRAFHPGDGGLTNIQLSDRTGLGPSTVSRLSYTLTRLGYLRYSATTGTYHLTAALLPAGFIYLSQLRIRTIALPLMRELADKVGDGHLIALSTRDMLSMTCVAHARARTASAVMDIEPGYRIPVGRSAAGWAYLAQASEEERDRVTSAIRSADGTRADETLGQVSRGIISVQKHGYCLNLGQMSPDIHAVGVPVTAGAGDGPGFVLTCGGSRFLLPQDKLKRQIAPELMHAAAQIVARLRAPHQ